MEGSNLNCDYENSSVCGPGLSDRGGKELSNEEKRPLAEHNNNALTQSEDPELNVDDEKIDLLVKQGCLEDKSNSDDKINDSTAGTNGEGDPDSINSVLREVNVNSEYEENEHAESVDKGAATGEIIDDPVGKEVIYNTDKNTTVVDHTEQGHIDTEVKDAVVSPKTMCEDPVAMMTERCTPASPDRTSRVNRAGHCQVFYVEQTKPSPMPPLQVWSGYNGNVYFEPIKVHSAKPAPPETSKSMPQMEKCSDQLRQILLSRRRARSSNSLPSMSSSRNSARYNTRHRKMALLDKDAVFDEKNKNIQEDIIWIMGQESTGSLCILPTDETGEIEIYKGSRSPLSHRKSSAASRERSLDRERICRGSVAHKIYAARNTERPLLSVTGGRYYQPQMPSTPLLRTQTQFSLSNQRCLNSPDIFAGLDKLPPLEQLRASLKHIEPDNAGGLARAMSPLDRIRYEDTDAITKERPFVKYSPEVRNSARIRQNQLSARYQRVM